MLWLAAAIIALLISVFGPRRKSAVWEKGGVIAFYGLLIAWIINEAGLQAFQGSETSFLGLFVAGLAILAVGELVAGGGAQASWSRAAAPVAAAAFALGFDVLRPDAYSYIPAAIVGLMVLAVAWRVYSRLSQGGKKKKKASVNAGLLLYTLSVALLLYSALFKMIDRGWLLPWAYLASAGALLFAATQLLLGWEKVLKQRRVAAWVRVGTTNLGVLMMVVAAFFVYREFL